ncbi:MAG: hypothetical protein JNM09_20245 [Blastocatellia bacterium]|nr:hypothetical protein [Blastocatellia bacterium]
MKCTKYLGMALGVMLSSFLAWAQQMPSQDRQILRQEHEAEIEVDPPLVIRGRTSTIYFVAKSLPAIKSVTIIPPVGVRVAEIKAAETRPDGRQAVPVIFVADSEAWGGLRVAMIETETRTYRVDIRLGTHPITISNLKFAMASPTAEQAEVSFDFTDEAGDIKPNDDSTRVQVMLMCNLWGRSPSLPPTKIVMSDERNGTVYLTLPKEQLQSGELTVTELREAGVKPAEQKAKQKPMSIQAGCQLSVALQDRDGNESNRLKTIVRFK